jgi:DNA replication and repair protein RecF
MLKNITLTNFRNYQNLSLNTDSDIIVLYGDNGQGKTNFLESVYYLALLRSFRSSSVKSLKQINSKGFYISGKLSSDKSWDRNIEIEYFLSKRRFKIDNVPILKSADFIRFIKPVVFSHEDINIITGSSKLRRRYIDIFISSIDSEYFSALREYMTALKSRNTLLRFNTSNNNAMLAAFEPVLAKNACIILNKRYKIIKKLKDRTELFIKEVKGTDASFDIKYLSKFKENDISEAEILDILRNDREKDIKKGYTSTGPHLEDLDFIYNGKSLRFYGSLGQCRISSLCMKMSELKLVGTNDKTGNIIALIDDVTGELDSKTKDSFFNTISDADQLFFTLTNSNSKESYFNDALKLSVKDGEIKEN